MIFVSWWPRSVSQSCRCVTFIFLFSFPPSQSDPSPLRALFSGSPGEPRPLAADLMMSAGSQVSPDFPECWFIHPLLFLFLPWGEVQVLIERICYLERPFLHSSQLSCYCAFVFTATPPVWTEIIYIYILKYNLLSLFFFFFFFRLCD